MADLGSIFAGAVGGVGKGMEAVGNRIHAEEKAKTEHLKKMSLLEYADRMQRSRTTDQNVYNKGLLADERTHGETQVGSWGAAQQGEDGTWNEQAYNKGGTLLEGKVRQASDPLAKEKLKALNDKTAGTGSTGGAKYNNAKYGRAMDNLNDEFFSEMQEYLAANSDDKTEGVDMAQFGGEDGKVNFTRLREKAPKDMIAKYDEIEKYIEEGTALNMNPYQAFEYGKQKYAFEVNDRIVSPIAKNLNLSKAKVQKYLDEDINPDFVKSFVSSYDPKDKSDKEFMAVLKKAGSPSYSVLIKALDAPTDPATKTPKPKRQYGRVAVNKAMQAGVERTLQEEKDDVEQLRLEIGNLNQKLTTASGVAKRNLQTALQEKINKYEGLTKGLL